MKISVITPTYNRAYILTQCYESLCNQTNKDFEWIVVDDGSTDETESVIRNLIDEGKIQIIYKKQNNGGKHRAHNTAVALASGILTVCLDSDDMLTPDAIEIAIKEWELNCSNNVIGILALRGDIQHMNPICSSIPKGIKYASITTLRDKYQFEGDTVLFFKTDLLKKVPFKEFEGENFLTETNLYCDLDKYGEMVLHNEVLYLCEYRSDGLTAKYHRLLFDNPLGTADTYYKMALMSSSFIKTLKYGIISQAYNRLVKPTSRIKYPDKHFTLLFARIFAPFFAFKYFRSIK